MRDESKTCATGCGQPRESGQSKVCGEHGKQWKQSGEHVRAEAILKEFPAGEKMTPEQMAESIWRTDIAKADFVKRISVEIAAVKLGKVVPPKPAPAKL
jgi:hypothetical protein